MSDYIVISFATNDHYADIGRRFEENLNDLQVPYDMEYIDPYEPDQASLRFCRKEEDRVKCATCRKGKVTHILKKLEEYDKTLIWLDCDDMLLARPIIHNFQFDVGFCLAPENKRKVRTVMANAIAFNPTDNARHFLRVWRYLNDWPELEAGGDEHIRLCHAKHICFDLINSSQKKLNFIGENITDGIKVKLNGHRPRNLRRKHRRLR